MRGRRASSRSPWEDVERAHTLCLASHTPREWLESMVQMAIRSKLSAANGLFTLNRATLWLPGFNTTPHTSQRPPRPVPTSSTNH